ncbi:MAG: Citrate synthase [bacterium]|nr:Citrate synthase [bacterium]
MSQDTTLQQATNSVATGTDAVELTDRRTGKHYTFAVQDDAIQAKDLLQVRSPQGQGLCTYDPGFLNTASCKSRITFIDGDQGILEYRGYPIAELAERVSFLEVAWLLLEGELPSSAQLASFEQEIGYHSLVPDFVQGLISAFPRNAHPMTMLMSAVAALGVQFPESKEIRDAANRRQQIIRLIAKMPTLAAMIARHNAGQDAVLPDNQLPYAANFLQMVFGQSNGSSLEPAVVRAMDVLLTLHADHEQNCSTNAVRGVGSSLADPYTAVAAGIGALYGPAHGGANEAVLVMLKKIGDVSQVPAFIDSVKTGQGRLMGFGHRVYKNYDPRARIIRELAEQVFAVTQPHPLLPVAKELERIALEDQYFVSRKLYPNVDFYSGLIYQALGFPVEFFTVLFAVGRTPGWCAQWDEAMGDPDMKIARPKQIYLGPRTRHLPPR